MSEDDIATRVTDLLANKRSALSKTITLIESQRTEHRHDADRVMQRLLLQTPERRGKALRIGICGAPGAGKSSLIEKLGLKIVNQEQKQLAVLAIDPSSQRTGGSILGDKTRMDQLSIQDKAYVRPSPTKGILGGVALNTGEVQLLCQHSGYEVILTETVGVGQSEIEIDQVSDFVVYVVPPGSGDGLQGAKKGVMEIADLIVINKYDSEFKTACKGLQRKLESALTLTMSKHTLGVQLASDKKIQPKKQWYCPVELVSADEDFNVLSIWKHAIDFQDCMGQDYLRSRRQKQMQRGMWKFLGEAIMHKLQQQENNPYSEIITNAERDLFDGKISGHQAAQQILRKMFQTL